MRQNNRIEGVIDTIIFISCLGHLKLNFCSSRFILVPLVTSKPTKDRCIQHSHTSQPNHSTLYPPLWHTQHICESSPDASPSLALRGLCLLGVWVQRTWKVATSFVSTCGLAVSGPGTDPVFEVPGSASPASGSGCTTVS